jgi:S-adenosylmethionine/arginine decarboxylase-like enzyme
MELESCPKEDEKAECGEMIKQLAHDIGMKPLDDPRVYYVSHPHYNEGLTAIMPIETSHIAFHFWKKPDPKILQNPNSKCLLEFDIYTCGTLSKKQVITVLHHLTKYVPTRVNATVLNRKWSLAVEYGMKWDRSNGPWEKYLEHINF